MLTIRRHTLVEANETCDGNARLMAVLLEKLPFENTCLCERIRRPVWAALPQVLQNSVGLRQNLAIVSDTNRNLAIGIHCQELFAACLAAQDIHHDPVVLEPEQCTQQFEFVTIT